MSQLANNDASPGTIPLPPASPSNRRYVENLPPLTEGRRTPRLHDALPSRTEGAGTPRQERFTPREPFFLPNMEPLARQQGLIFEQAELLREQFMKFAESLQRLHGVVEELREDIQFERQQRQYGEESTAAALASVRTENDGEKRKLETAQRQLEERVLSLREECALRGRASDGEFQRVAARSDALRTEIIGQLSKVDEDHRLASDHSKAKIIDLHDSLHSHRTNADASLQGLREEFLHAIASQDSNFQQRVATLDIESQQSSSAIKSLESKLLQLGEQQHQVVETMDKLRSQFTDGIARVQESGESGLQRLALQADESRSEYLQELQAAEAQRLVGQETLQSFVSSSKESEKVLAGNLAQIEAGFKDKLAALEDEIARDAERSLGELTTINHLLSQSEERLGTEMDAERRQRGVSTVGLVTELAAVKDSLAQELEAQRKTESHISDWAKEASSLWNTIQAEEKAQAVLSAQVSRQSSATEKLRNALEERLEASIASANDNFNMGHQELWHVFNEMEDSTAKMSSTISKDCRELQLRTTTLEKDRLGKLHQEMEEFASLNGRVAQKIDTLEKSSLQEQVALTSRLDGYAHDFEKTKSVIDGLVGSPSRGDFIESPNAQYRLYITPDGDVAVFKRNGWGKHGSDWQGVPRWHAGIVGDKAVCSVNRDMQVHERDRFLTLANRSLDHGSDF